MTVTLGLDLGHDTVRVAALIADRPVPVTAFPSRVGRDGDRVVVGRAAAALPPDAAPVTGSMAEQLAWKVRAALLAVETAHGPVFGAGIAVPPEFGAVERRAVRDAAAIAGLPAARLVAAPVAVALSLPSAPDGRWLVCDAGAAAFTVTVVDRAGGAVDRLASAVEPGLGGHALDRIIAEHLARGLDLAADGALSPMLLAVAKVLKEHLGNAAAAEAALAAALEGAEPPLRGFRPPRRDELELWMTPRVRAVDEVCTRALAAAGVASTELSEVVLAGGGARLLILGRRLGQVMARPPRLPADPGFAAALGAARLARMFVAEPTAVVVDVVPHALALGAGAEPTLLVPAGAVLPTREARLIATRSDDEVAIEVELWEQTAPPRPLGRWRLGDLPTAPAGDAFALCNVTVDVDGVPRVTATELVSGAALVATPMAAPGIEAGLDADAIAARRAAMAEWIP